MIYKSMTSLGTQQVENTGLEENYHFAKPTFFFFFFFWPHPRQVKVLGPGIEASPPQQPELLQ